MQMRGGIQELMRQATRIQKKVEETKEKLKSTELSGSAAGEKIQVTVTYGGNIRRISVDPLFLQNEGLELTLDSIVAALNATLKDANDAMEKELGKVTGGMKIPGLT